MLRENVAHRSPLRPALPLLAGLAGCGGVAWDTAVADTAEARRDSIIGVSKEGPTPEEERIQEALKKKIDAMLDNEPRSRPS